MRFSLNHDRNLNYQFYKQDLKRQCYLDQKLLKTLFQFEIANFDQPSFLNLNQLNFSPFFFLYKFKHLRLQYSSLSHYFERMYIQLHNCHSQYLELSNYCYISISLVSKNFHFRQSQN